MIGKIESLTTEVPHALSAFERDLLQTNGGDFYATQHQWGAEPAVAYLPTNTSHEVHANTGITLAPSLGSIAIN